MLINKIMHLTKFIHDYIILRLLEFSRIKRAADLVLVLPPNGSGGWVLDRICYEISIKIPKSMSIKLIRSNEPFIKATQYFFSHYMFFIHAYKRGDLPKNARVYIWFTHLESKKHGISDLDLMGYLKKADGIFCQNSPAKDNLIRNQIDKDKVFVVIGGGDETFFYPKDSDEKKYIGFVSAYYPRKNPELIHSIISKMPHENFLLIGRNWENYHQFNDLMALTNLTYISCEYGEYPDFYRSMQVLISPSKLEGGPVPIIEALLTNVPVIASNTGFAADIIIDGKNGYLFSVDSIPDDVIALIQKISALQKNIRATALQFTWANYSRKIIDVLRK